MRKQRDWFLAFVLLLILALVILAGLAVDRILS
jgi:hypothetical protein